MINFSFLTTLILIPLIGSIFIALNKGENANKNSLMTGSFVTGLVFLLIIIIFYKFDFYKDELQMLENFDILPNFYINYIVGVDFLSLIFLTLLSLLFLVAFVVMHFNAKIVRKEIIIAILILEAMCIGGILSQNLLLFFLFFQGILIPMFVLMALSMKEKSFDIILKYSFSALIGMTFLLPSFIYLVILTKTGFIPDIKGVFFIVKDLDYIWWFIFVGFAVYLPLTPFHVWLIDFLNKSKLSINILLLGVITSFGTYGFLRVNLGILGVDILKSLLILKILIFICLLYVIYRFFLENNAKKAIIYITFSYYSVYLLAFLSNNSIIISASIFNIITTSIASVGLLILLEFVGSKKLLYDINEMRNKLSISKRYNIFFLILVLSMVGFPFLGSFFSKYLIIKGSFDVDYDMLFLLFLLLSLLGILLLNFYCKLFLGRGIKEEFVNFFSFKFFKSIVIISLILILCIFSLFFENIIEPLILNINYLTKSATF